MKGRWERGVGGRGMGGEQMGAGEGSGYIVLKISLKRPAWCQILAHRVIFLESMTMYLLPFSIDLIEGKFRNVSTYVPPKSEG